MLPFSKYSGLGNDFIFIEGKPLSIASIVRLCDRHDGIGADGIFFYKKEEAVIFNSDGSNPSLCGNGLRCLFHHLHRTKKMGSKGSVTIGGQIYHGEVKGKLVSVQLGTPKTHLQNHPLTIDEKIFYVDLIDTGVPHFVVKDPAFPFEESARTLRHHPSAPQGANVNLFLGKKVRTYERGCEQETYACGTGIAACAYSHHLSEKAPFPMTLFTVKGKPLSVDLKEGSLWIEGEATFVFQGELNLDILSV